MKKVFFSIVICLFFLTSCSSSTTSPKIILSPGITLLSEIDPAGFQSPIWSPDGTRIVASYVIEASPDFFGSFGEPRHDIVIIEPDTWKVSVLLSENSGNLQAETWSPDSKSFTMFWSDGPAGSGIYIFGVDDTKPIYLSEAEGLMSPDWKENALNTNYLLSIMNIKTKDVQIFKFPKTGSWSVVSWSSDSSQLALIYKEHEDDKFENIYLLDLSSGKFSQLSDDNKYFKDSPSISPNGNLIAYRMWQFTQNDIESNVFISRSDRSCSWTIPINHINYFTWSPNSNKMFLSGTDGVYIADLEKVFGESFVSDSDCR